MLIDLIGGIKWEWKIDNVFGQVKQSKKNMMRVACLRMTEKDVGSGIDYVQLFQGDILQKEEK